MDVLGFSPYTYEIALGSVVAFGALLFGALYGAYKWQERDARRFAPHEGAIDTNLVNALGEPTTGSLPVLRPRASIRRNVVSAAVITAAIERSDRLTLFMPETAAALRHADKVFAEIMAALEKPPGRHLAIAA